MLPQTSKFLVVDGQHRLYAQEYSEVEGIYPCVIHMNRSEAQMAELFLRSMPRQASSVVTETSMTPPKNQAQVIVLRQTDPDIYLTALPGKWLLDHATEPSWRIKKPDKTWLSTAIVNTTRAKAIAHTVLDESRAVSKRDCACNHRKDV